MIAAMPPHPGGRNIFMIRSFLVTIALAGSVSLVSTPSCAETVSQTVRYADLNLANSAGRNVLAMRVAGAIRQICGPAGSRDLNQAANSRNCFATARKDADVKVATLTRASQRLAARSTDIVFASR